MAWVDIFSRRLSQWQQRQQQRRSQNNSRIQPHPAVPSEFLAVFGNQVAAAHVQVFTCVFFPQPVRSAQQLGLCQLCFGYCSALLQCSELMPALSLRSSPVCSRLSCVSPRFLLFLSLCNVSPLCFGQCLQFAQLARFGVENLHLAQFTPLSTWLCDFLMYGVSQKKIHGWQHGVWWANHGQMHSRVVGNFGFSIVTRTGAWSMGREASSTAPVFCAPGNFSLLQCGHWPRHSQLIRERLWKNAVSGHTLSRVIWLRGPENSWRRPRVRVTSLKRSSSGSRMLKSPMMIHRPPGCVGRVSWIRGSITRSSRCTRLSSKCTLQKAHQPCSVRRGSYDL